MPRWTSQHREIDGWTTQATLRDGPKSLTWGEVIGLWRSNAEFREFFTGLICESQFEAFFWETPAVTRQTLDRPFEFVLVEGKSLPGLRPDRSHFALHFMSHPSEAVVTFPNLGGDAILVVPAPVAEDGCYTHLARFLRKAPPGQVDMFWQRVGTAMEERISDTPVWLSTAGLGVSWLHLRLDSRPKYYRHEPYKAMKGTEESE